MFKVQTEMPDTECCCEKRLPLDLLLLRQVHLLNIDNNLFDSMVSHICLSELQLKKANVSCTETSFSDLRLSISDGIVKTKNV